MLERMCVLVRTCVCECSSCLSVYMYVFAYLCSVGAHVCAGARVCMSVRLNMEARRKPWVCSLVSIHFFCSLFALFLRQGLSLAG